MTRKAKQEEIPGTEGPARDDELHAIGLSIKDCENVRKALTAKEGELREQAAQRLDALGVNYYHVDGVEVSREKKSKIKVHLDKDDKE
jgi:hypothetical protein